MKYYLGVSYFSNRMPEHFIRDLEIMKKNGMNQVLLTFSENDQEFYHENIREFVDQAHDLQMRVYIGPWSVGGVFGGEADSKYIAWYVEGRQVLNNRDRAPSACMNNPHFRRFFTSWIESAIQTGADVLFLDEPHFFIPGWNNPYHRSDTHLWGCRCQCCQEKFQQENHVSMPEEVTELVDQFRRKSIWDFVAWACQEAKRIKPTILTSLCLVTDEYFLNSDLPYQLTKIEALDEIGTDPYWGSRTGAELDNYLRDEFTQACRILDRIQTQYKKQSQLWIKNFLVKSGTEDAIRRGIEIADHHHLSNIMAWSYQGTRYMSKMKSEQPDKVWEVLSMAFMELRKSETVDQIWAQSK